MRSRRQRSNRAPDLKSVKAEHGALASYYARKRAETAAALGNIESVTKWCVIEAELDANELGERDRRD